MFEGPYSSEEFFEEARFYIEASMQDRKTDKPDYDDLLFAMSMINNGQYVNPPRFLNPESFQNDLTYVMRFGRPEGFERVDAFEKFKEAYDKFAPTILKEYQERMEGIVSDVDDEYEAYQGDALDHAQDQYTRDTDDEFNQTSPLSVDSMARYFIRHTINAQQRNMRANGNLDGPLKIDANIKKSIATGFATITRDPLHTLKILYGRSDTMHPIGVRHFLHALDPDFYQLMVQRNNPELQNSNAIPESSMPARDINKYMLKAQTVARNLMDPTMEPRHFFLALLEDNQVASELNALNNSARKVDLAKIRDHFYTEDAPVNVDNPEPSAAFTQMLADIGPEFADANGKFGASLAVQKMLETYPEIQDKLRQAGFTQRRLDRWAAMAGKEVKAAANVHRPFKIQDHVFKEAIEKYTKNITQMADDGKLDPIIGRDDELEQMKTIMTHRKKKNPMVIGEPGVGKTALLHGYAQDVVDGNVPDNQKGAQVLELDLKALVAGTRYRGDFEERLQNIIDGVAERNERGDRPPIILGIDEAHTLVGLGNASSQTQGADQFLKPALQEGNLWTIMFTTEDEFTKHIEGDGALERRTQTLKVEEPTPEHTVAILKGLRDKYEDHYDLSISDEAIEDMVKLAGKYVTNRNFPDKGIDLLDGAGAVAFKKGKDTVDRDDVVEVVARMAKL
ncbi:MAG: AAA family ATPase, partial [Pseudomonadota bacterium]